MNVDLDDASIRAAQQFLFGPSPVPADPPMTVEPPQRQDDVERRIAELLAAQNARLHEINEAQEEVARRPIVLKPVAARPRAAARPRELVLRATGIHRAGNGWQVRCRGGGVMVSKYVADSRYDGYVGAFIEALDVRDELYGEHDLPIPPAIEAVVDGERVAPELLATRGGLAVRWRGKDYEVSGEDAEEIATEIALDVFVEYLQTLRDGVSVAA